MIELDAAGYAAWRMAQTPHTAIVMREDGSALIYESEEEMPESMRERMICTVSARQIRLALNQLGLRDAVEAAIAASSREVRDWWEYSIELHRDHPMVVNMLPSIGVSPEQADAVWSLAGTL